MDKNEDLENLQEKEQDTKNGKDRFKAIGFDLFTFVKTSGLSIVVGIGVGAYASLFALLINFLTQVRTDNSWLIFLLPVGGVAIVGFYRLLKVDHPKGTNRVLESISSNESLPLRMTPLITVGTAITHLLGGSAGREGAALQIGGSLGASFAKGLKLEKREITIMTLCGMSAAFAAMFGTPLTATIFSIEVVSIGILHYSAIVPCAIASIVAGFMASLVRYIPEAYPVVAFPKFNWLYGLKSVGFGIVCAVVSIVFCIILHQSEHLFKKAFKNSYVRAIIGGVVIIALTVLIRTTDFNGAGVGVIFSAVEGNAHWYSFILKMVFTAVTLGCCYKGGEIIPTIFVGATFGCAFAPLIGIPAGVGAALGICGVFCGVTNCPLASIALCFELFGIQGLPFFLLVSAVSYRLSGYYGIYTGQKIIYSKAIPLFVNKVTHE